MQKQTQNFRWRVTHKAYGTVEVEGVDRLRAIIAAAMTWKQRWTLIARACETEKLGPARRGSRDAAAAHGPSAKSSRAA